MTGPCQISVFRYTDFLSIVTQLINSTSDRSETPNQPERTDLRNVLCLSKAFNKVSHHHLSDKLTHYGISKNAASFPTVNSQFQLMAPTLPGLTLHRVPQGSVLRPVICIICINDIKEHIQLVIKLFADDSILCRK